MYDIASDNQNLLLTEMQAGLDKVQINLIEDAEKVEVTSATNYWMCQYEVPRDLKAVAVEYGNKSAPSVVAKASGHKRDRW